MTVSLPAVNFTFAGPRCNSNVPSLTAFSVVDSSDRERKARILSSAAMASTAKEAGRKPSI